MHAAFDRVRAPGRLEVMGTQPLVIIDGAHNVGGAGALIRALAEEFAPAPRTLVVGLLREKDPAEMLAALEAARAERLVCTRPPSPRAMDPATLAEAAISLGLDPGRVDIAPGVDGALATRATSPAPTARSS